MSHLPVTFTDHQDNVGTVHNYEGDPRRSNVTLCGLTLAHDHGVASPMTSKPFCEECYG